MKASTKYFSCNFYSFEYKPESWDFEILIWVDGNLPDDIQLLDDDAEFADYDEFKDAVVQYMDKTGLNWGFVPIEYTYEM